MGLLNTRQAESAPPVGIGADLPSQDEVASATEKGKLVDLDHLTIFSTLFRMGVASDRVLRNVWISAAV